MSVQNPFDMHYQSVWMERAGDRRMPYWLRVAALGFGCHCRNGHARLEPGQAAMVLGTVNEDTGEIQPLEKNNVQRAIGLAVEYGWLAEGSSALCLVVPGHAVTGGLCGSASDVCPLERRHKRLAESQRGRREAKHGRPRHLHAVDE